MIPKVQIFENVFPYSATIRFVTKFGGNQPLQSCRKVVWFTTRKKTRAPRDSFQPPFCPKWADRAQNYLNFVTPWYVHVYRIWSGSAAFCRTYSGKIDYRLLAYNNSRHSLFLYIYPAIGGESCTLHDISLFLRTTGLLVWLSLGTEFVIRWCHESMTWSHSGIDDCHDSPGRS